MRALGGIAPYAVLLILVILALSLHRPAEAELPDHTEKPWPEVEVRGLAVPPTAAGRPGFTAGRAVPRAKDGPITLGGWREGMALQDVAVELAPGWSLRGRAGALVGDRLLVFDRVSIEREDRRCLEASRVEFVDDQIRFTGPVLIHTTRSSTTEVNLTWTRDELLRRLR